MYLRCTCWSTTSIATTTALPSSIHLHLCLSTKQRWGFCSFGKVVWRSQSTVVRPRDSGNSGRGKREERSKGIAVTVTNWEPPCLLARGCRKQRSFLLSLPSRLLPRCSSVVSPVRNPFSLFSASLLVRSASATRKMRWELIDEECRWMRRMEAAWFPQSFPRSCFFSCSDAPQTLSKILLRRWPLPLPLLQSTLPAILSSSARPDPLLRFISL